jgi:predicted nucleotidyltransferase|nr:MAG TPA: Cell cycle protein [Caudoviricetes sp.]
MVFSAEKVQEIVEEKETEYKKLEEEYSFLKEEFEDLKAENEDLEDKCESYKKANKTVLCIYHEDIKKMDDLQKFNNKLVESCKKANRDFFILAAAYVATLMLMIYLFIR